MLQVAVGREGEPPARLPTGIEGDQLARDILNGFLGGVLELEPRPAAELVDLRRLAVAALVAGDAVEGVDVHEEHVVIPVHQLDGLVYPAVFVDFDQPAEASDPVVDMHHVIPHAKLVQLGDGHLLVAFDLPIDAVALVAVENLVVGIEAAAQVVVHEPFVERQGQGLEAHLSPADLPENVLQAFDLRLVFREDVGRVAPLRRGEDVVGQQLEILVEAGLRRGVEIDDRIGGPLAQAVPQQHQAALRHIFEQGAAAGQPEVDGLRLVRLREHPFAQVVDPPQGVIGIGEPVGDPLAGEAGEGDARLLPLPEVGNDLGPLEPLRGELARNLESADRVHVVAEEIQTERLALGEGEDIDDAAPHGVLARLIDEIDLHEPRIGERLHEHRNRDALPDPDADGFARERLPVGHPLGERLGIGANHQVGRLLPAPGLRLLSRKTRQGIERHRALHHPLRILGAIDDRTLVGAREEEDARLVEQGVEVVEQVGRSVAVLGHEDVHTPRAADGRRRMERQRPTHQLAQVEGLRPFAAGAQEAAHRLRG